MNKKVLYIVPILVVITLYGALKGNYFTNEKNSNDNILPEPVSLNNDIKPEIQKFSISEDLKQYEELSEYIKQKTTSVCGNSNSGQKIAYITNKQNTELTENQLDALDKILNECIDWFSYFDSLDNESKRQIAVEKHNSMKVVKYYLKNNLDSNTLNEARLTMDTGGDASAYSYMALNYLLLHDDELVSTIAKKLGTNDIDYIRNSNINLVELYTCSIAPKSCHSDSIRVLNFCLTYNQSCDMTFQQHIASMVSPNQFNDLMNMVDIIKMLIKEGYFS